MNEKKYGVLLHTHTPSQTETTNHNYYNTVGVVNTPLLRVHKEQRFPDRPLSSPSWTKKTRSTQKGVRGNGHYEPLPKAFKASGFNYSRIAREGEIAIYEQTWGGCSEPSVCYEVIRVRRAEATTFPNGKRYPAPGNISTVRSMGR